MAMKKLTAAGTSNTVGAKVQDAFDRMVEAEVARLTKEYERDHMADLQQIETLQSELRWRKQESQQLEALRALRLKEHSDKQADQLSYANATHKLGLFFSSLNPPSPYMGHPDWEQRDLIDIAMAEIKRLRAKQI